MCEMDPVCAAHQKMENNWSIHVVNWIWIYPVTPVQIHLNCTSGVHHKKYNFALILICYSRDYSWIISGYSIAEALQLIEVPYKYLHVGICMLVWLVDEGIITYTGYKDIGILSTHFKNYRRNLGSISLLYGAFNIATLI